MTTDALFDGFEPPTKAEEYLSAGRRRTVNHRRNIEMGWHPLMGSKTHPGLGTCGDCRFRQVVQWHDRSYAKCFEEHAPKPTHGASTDVRAWWPACQFHALGDPKLSPDAARWKP